MKFFDLHCDTAHSLANGGSLANGDSHITLQKAAGLERWVQVFAMFVHDNEPGTDSAYETYCRLTDAMRRELEINRETIVQCRTGRELGTAFAEGKYAAVFSVENGAVLGGRKERLAQLQRDGVRFLTLTWMGENELGGGSCVGGGLTDFGKEVVTALPEYGIIPDISHLSDEGVADVFRIYDGPVVATHSNVRSVTGHHRNMTKHQIEEVIRRKGLIGINLYRAFLNGEPAKACREDVYRHLDAFLSLGAENTVCSGTDFDGAEIPPDIRDLAGIPALYDYLIGRGIPERILNRVFFDNAFEFFERSFL